MFNSKINQGVSQFHPINHYNRAQKCHERNPSRPDGKDVSKQYHNIKVREAVGTDNIKDLASTEEKCRYASAVSVSESQET